jgi:FKBP-type peptidyl-prolyl cis-trans isomerase
MKKLLFIAAVMSIAACANKSEQKPQKLKEPAAAFKAPTDKKCTEQELPRQMWVRRPMGYGITDEKRFFADLAALPDVVKLPSGVFYRVLRSGCGKSPSLNNKVTVRYHLTLLDGTVIDSSYYRKETPTFPLNSVIPGWAQAVQLMQPGAIWEIFVPYTQGYGPAGGGPVPGYAGLYFTVELIDF